MNTHILDGFLAGLKEKFYGGIENASITVTKGATLDVAIVSAGLTDSDDNPENVVLTGYLIDKEGTRVDFKVTGEGEDATVTLPSGFGSTDVDSIVTLSTEKGYKADFGLYNINLAVNGTHTYKFERDQGREPSGLREGTA